MESKKVSIIIPCYKQAHWLGDAITSCIEQTHQNIEIIVVNDGSPDNTSEVANSYSQVRLIEKENGGLSSARNAGIKESNGDYIITLDADDKIHSQYIEKTLGIDDIVSVSQQEFGDSNNIWHPPFLNPKYEDFYYQNCIQCCSIYKKEIWNTIGGYDEDMKVAYEDWDFWLRATKKGYNVSVVKEPLFFYRKHGYSMINKGILHYNNIVEYMHTKIAFNED